MTFWGSSKSKGTSGSFKLEIRNLSGVPVLDIIGEINGMTIRAIEDTASRLVQAGHYHLVLNIQKAAKANASALRSLARLAHEVKKHYGGVTLVGGMEHAGQRLSGELRRLFRFCTSEADALSKIKGSRNIVDARQTGTTARLAE